MTDKHTLLDTLHDATHRVPGVPAHTPQAAGHQGGHRAGHQGGAHHGRTAQAAHRSHGRPANYSPRSPRVLVAWQRRIAALFRQDV
ncbi:hypothetical protein Cch01nite_43280 [Cellulomonas chitinilytica]|uniref:Uncharacterized protein n=1 Tax=Cellulomonas chitinilytica TaxID=398759 RepID=A0A919U4X9_9CELL|nr:hypothetical protein [Cellulomonas chitinilytica]GIG23604.1 hypothetical protein Cch01nite_43280 [Cellulomonas chitinilytica]